MNIVVLFPTSPIDLKVSKYCLGYALLKLFRRRLESGVNFFTLIRENLA
jgi:hypothetical protein